MNEVEKASLGNITKFVTRGEQILNAEYMTWAATAAVSLDPENVDSVESPSSNARHAVFYITISDEALLVKDGKFLECRLCLIGFQIVVSR